MEETPERGGLDASLPQIPSPNETATPNTTASTYQGGAPVGAAGAPDPAAVPDPLAAGAPDLATSGTFEAFVPERTASNHGESTADGASPAYDGPEEHQGPSDNMPTDPYIPQIDYEVPDVPSTTDSPRGTTLRRALALLAIAAIGIAFALFLITRGFGLFAGSTLPDVKGYAEQDARRLLQDSGIPFSIREQSTENVQDDGKVLATIPTAGESLLPGRSATLVIGKVATETQTVPNLVGLTESEALNAISSTKFFLKDDVAHAFSDTVEQGRVISQGPSAGSTRQRGTKVDLVISNGPKPDGGDSSNERGSLTIPDVKGMTKDEASELLRGMGLAVEYGEGVRATTAPNGTVVVVTPEIGETVQEGSTVVICMALHEKRQVS